jgi:hypothetical protein
LSIELNEQFRAYIIPVMNVQLAHLLSGLTTVRANTFAMIFGLGIAS